MSVKLDGVLEDLAVRWGVPFCPEFELGLHRRLFAAELRAELDALSGAASAKDLARRGRVRRLLGDPEAAADLRAALDLNPKLAKAHAWLGEAGLGEAGSLDSLDRAIELEPKDGWFRTYRGAGRLLADDPKNASADLSIAAKLLKNEALPQFLLGLALSRLKKKTPADAALRRALALEPSSSSAALLRAKLWTGRKAATATEEALDAEPDHAHVALFTWKPESSWDGWLSRHAEFCFSERHLPLCARFGLDETRFSPYPAEAVALSTRALDARGRRAWTLAVHGRALARVPGGGARAKREARRLLDAAVAANPRAGWTWAWRALSRVGADPKGALSDLNKALTLSPHYFRAYSWRGALLRRVGRTLDSLSDLDRAAAGDERYPFSAHERSLTRRALGDLLGAAHDLDRAYGLDPRYSWVYASGREPSPEEREKGLKELAAAIKVHPASASLRAWRGELLWRAGKIGDAVLALEDAAALDPSHALAQGFLGLVLLGAGRPADALEPLHRAVSFDRRHLAFAAGLAEALRRCGRAMEAEAALASALKDRPKAWTLRLQRARWRLDDGRPAEALADARAAAALEGRDAEGWFLEARALAALRKNAQAEAAIGRALEIAPNLGRAWLLRAEVRRALGRAEEAVSDFRVVHDRFPYLLNEEERARMAALLGKS
jgi:tetratricopeptide (TPR) repeat protein